MEDNEAYQVLACAKAALKVEGDMAEVGVYKGGSAKLICEVKEEKPLHLFDTFEGLPRPGPLDDSSFFAEGQYAATSESVAHLLRDYPNVNLYKGIFPHTAYPLKETKFSFIHLDVDLYQSTIDSLQFFYPRLTQGGMILSHDFMIYSSVTRAFVTFFEDKPEPIIELSSSQCLIVKR